MGPDPYPIEIGGRRQARTLLTPRASPVYARTLSRRDEMADMPDSKSGEWQRSCRFKSDRRQKTNMKSIVSERGQVTIPKPLRDSLGLRAGTVVEFQVVKDKLILARAEAVDPLFKWLGTGRLPGGLGVDAYLERIRG